MLFETLLLEEVGQRLAKQPFQGFSWQQWANVIQVSPAISETHPLWELENHVLENDLRLFGLKPQELEHQIRAYRKKSRVIRWVLRLVTRINTKIAVWSYYQQCLSFRALQQKPLLALQKTNFPVDFTMTQTLLPYLRQDIKAFGTLIDRQLRSLNVTTDEFLDRYQDAARKHEARFFKLVENKLKNVAWKEKIVVEETLKEEYRGLRKMMNRFKNLCLKRALQVKEQLASFMPNPRPELKSDSVCSEDRPFSDTPFTPNPTQPQHDIVLRSEDDSASSDTSPFVPLGGAHVLADNHVNDVLPSTLEELTRLLAESDRVDQETAVRSFLEERLDQFYGLVQSQLDHHRTLVDAVKSGSLDYQHAIPQSEAIQRELISCFKTGLLLFHPDKHPSPNESIKPIQHALCCQFLNFRTESIRQLKQGVTRLRRLIPKESTLKNQQRQHEKALDELVQEYTQLYQEFTEDYSKFYANEKVRHDTRIAGIKTLITRQDAMITRQDAMITRQDAMITGIKTLRTRQDAMITGIKALRTRQDAMLAEIKELNALAASLYIDQEDHAVSDSETTETGPQFFTARR